MHPLVKVLAGVGVASSCVGVGFLVKHSLSTTASASVSPKRVLAHSLFEKKFGGKKMIAKDDWEAWKKKVQDHKNKPYWPNSLSVLTKASLSDSHVASALQSTCFNIDDGYGGIKGDVLLKKNFETKAVGHESVNLEEVVPKLCGAD